MLFRSGGRVYSGRLALLVEAGPGSERRQLSAGFEYTALPESGRLSLDGPLGARLAEARWDPQGVTLTDSQGEQRFDSLLALSQQVLGEALPLDALGDWLAGHPWPGAATTTTDTGFRQGDWDVDTQALAERGVLLVQRQSPAPAVRLRILLDR